MYYSVNCSINITNFCVVNVYLTMEDAASEELNSVINMIILKYPNYGIILSCARNNTYGRIDQLNKLVFMHVDTTVLQQLHNNASKVHTVTNWAFVTELNNELEARSKGRKRLKGTKRPIKIEER